MKILPRPPGTLDRPLSNPIFSPVSAGRMCDQICAYHRLRRGVCEETVALTIFESMRVRDPFWRYAFQISRGLDSISEEDGVQ